MAMARQSGGPGEGPSTSTDGVFDKKYLREYVKLGSAELLHVKGKSSIVWDDFRRIKFKEALFDMYACQRCYSTYKLDKTGSTKSLKMHLKTCRKAAMPTNEVKIGRLNETSVYGESGGRHLIKLVTGMHVHSDPLSFQLSLT